MITYNDIKAKRDEARAAKKAYVQSLRDVAKKLVDAYVASLQLTSEYWVSLEGEKRPYVFIIDQGFECKAEDLRVDLQDGAKFELHTVTDDDPREPLTENVRVGINVIDAEKIEVIVRGYRIEAFAPVDTDEKINEVCEFIKDSILMSMNGVSFGAGASKESVKLWD